MPWPMPGRARLRSRCRSMSHELRLKEEALAEWRRLDGSVRAPFKAKLAERLNHPRLPAARLHGHPDRHKIKLRAAGWRLVYEARDATVTVVVIAVGKRARNAVHAAAARRD